MRDVTCPEWSFDGAKMLEPVSSVYQGNPRLLGCGGARSRRNEASERIGHLNAAAHELVAGAPSAVAVCTAEGEKRISNSQA
mmetsp:Transcript_13624/g.40379  ORF Transcript_13624/g.40379 Transcript_13624/m.40379 type:complete len:82 (+) Transcript_13624:289-534(+)